MLNTNDSAPCVTHEAADQAVGHLDVGDLERHADHEGEIREVPVVRLVLAGEDQAVGAFALAVIVVRVVQREQRVDEGPGQRDGRDRQRRRASRSSASPWRRASSAKIARGSRSRPRPGATAARSRLRPASRRGERIWLHVRAHHHLDGENEIERDADVPADQQLGGGAPLVANDEQQRDRRRARRRPTMNRRGRSFDDAHDARRTAFRDLRLLARHAGIRATNPPHHKGARRPCPVAAIC